MKTTADRAQSKCTALPHRWPRQQGLSLIELLIALVLGVIIVIAMSQLFVNISRANTEMAKTNSQIENARFAMQFLQGDIVHAGYWGGFLPEFDDFALPGAPGDVPVAKPTPVCLPFDVATWDEAYRESLIGIPLEVYGPGAMPAGCNAIVTDRVADTDLLIVRHAATCVAGDAGCEAFNAAKLYLRVSNCNSDVDRYELDPDPATYVVKERDCTALAARRKFIQNIYYIRSWANAVGDGIPTLVRSEFDLVGSALEQKAPVALVEGVERFRVEVGIDRQSQTGGWIDYTAAIVWQDDDFKTTPINRGDGVPEAGFERCLSEDAACTVGLMTNVVAVKMYLLARANEATQGYTDEKSYTLGLEDVPAFNDSFKRHVFSATVRINNVAGRRETSGPVVVTP
jgi:type IV pilus assembly protein PilW